MKLKMKLKIIPNPNKTIFNNISKAVKANDGFCPCLLEQNENTKCMCKEFREQENVGECHCGLFVKTLAEQ